MIIEQGRKCGTCNACCTVVGVNELGKPCNFRCEFQTKRGCWIYGKHPESCRTYKCIWLEGFLHTDDRPDLSKVVFHSHEENGDLWLDAHVLADANPKEVASFVRHVWRKMGMFRGVRIISPDQIMNVDYDINTVKYPGGESDGREGTLWVTSDNIIYVLDAPSRIPLKVVT